MASMRWKSPADEQKSGKRVLSVIRSRVENRHSGSTILVEVASSAKAKKVLNGKAMMDWRGNMYRKKDKD